MPVKTERNRPGRRVEQAGEAVDEGPLHASANPAKAHEAVQRDATYREAQAQREAGVREGADVPRALREEPVQPQGGHHRRPTTPLKDTPHHRKVR